MSKSTIELSETAQVRLRELVETTGQSMSVVLDQALAAYRRELFFGKLNAGYAQMRADPQTWADHEAERKEWDVASMDGLDTDERWTDDGRCQSTEPDTNGR